MVNLTGLLLRRNAWNVQPDGYWKRRQVLKLSAHLYGRQRNCFSIAIRAVQKSLKYLSKGRQEWKKVHRELWEERTTAGAQELGYMPQGTPTILESLAQTQVLLNRQTLSDLSIWEPRTFKALNKIAAIKAHDVGLINLGPRPVDKSQEESRKKQRSDGS